MDDQYEEREAPTTTLRRDDDPADETIRTSGEYGWNAWRVHATFVYAAGLLGVKPVDFVGRVAEMMDHEGGLTVTWRTTPTPAEKWAVGKAWEDVGDEENIEHEIAK